MIARFTTTCVVALGLLQLAGCGGPGTYDPVQSDLGVILSEADLEIRRRAALSLSGQHFSDEQIQQLLAIAKDPNQDNVIRSRVIGALGGVEPERAIMVLPELSEIAKQAPRDSGLQHTAVRVIQSLAKKQQ